MPCYFNGLGRGCLPADHELAFLRTRGTAEEGGRPRRGDRAPRSTSGWASDGSARRGWRTSSTRPGSEAGHVDVPTAAGDLAPGARAGWRDHGGPRVDHEAWIGRLRDAESAAARTTTPLLTAASDPIKPARIYGELRQRLERRRGGHLRRRRLRQLRRQVHRGPRARRAGSTPGRTAASATVRATRSRPGWPVRRSQIVALLGDGAAGFSLMDADTLVRHDLPVVMIVGNNGIWGLEKHPMQAVYGWDVACDLQPGCRYDEVVRCPRRSGRDGAGPRGDRAGARPRLLRRRAVPGQRADRSR